MSAQETASEEWKRLLRGGFCFENAPFAVHPLDHQRAERMFFVATRAGASKLDILEEAQRYLRNERHLRVEAVDEQLARVKRLLSRYTLTGRAKQAWLVFWNGSEAFVTDTTSCLVQALDPRMSDQRIREFVELHYRAIEYSPRELLYYATRPAKSPYRAKANLSQDHRLISYTCGHNPWLEARFCRDIIICEHEDGSTRVSWSRDPLPRNSV